ncbi:MAG: aldehyde dehydrogenase family protein [Bacteroidales bacterium]|nr:aldehyde dehydrogenase family protein [Bacteroidales bacterium]
MTVQNIIAAQKVFFLSGQTKPVKFRIKKLKKLKTALQENEKYLYEAIYKDFGKSEFETYATELSLVYSEINLSIKKVSKWAKRKKQKTNLANLPGKSYIIPEPLGTCLVIGAWNYPYQLSLVPLVAAIAAGNTVILKPSELSKNSSSIMAKILNRVFIPEIIYVIEGGVKETTELLELKFDKIFFTGSVPVGEIIYRKAAKKLIPVTLELGGKSPTFVLNDANIKMTAKRIIWGKFLNAGQTCVATDYVLVDKKVEENLLEELKKQINIQFPSFEKLPENYVQIINDKNFERLLNLIDKKKVFIGGTFDREKRIIHPTVLHNITFEDNVMNDEIFGPVLPVISFEDLEKTIQEVQKRPKPLALYIFSKNKKIVKNIQDEISFGGGAVNETVMHLTNHRLPFGGTGSSGFGNYHGYAGFQTFSHFKSILKKPFWFEPPIKYAPYTKKKLKLMKRLMK